VIQPHGATQVATVHVRVSLARNSNIVMVA
jgi:hypothetical protein